MLQCIRVGSGKFLKKPTEPYHGEYQLKAELCVKPLDLQTYFVYLSAYLTNAESLVTRQSSLILILNLVGLWGLTKTLVYCPGGCGFGGHSCVDFWSLVTV